MAHSAYCKVCGRIRMHDESGNCIHTIYGKGERITPPEPTGARETSESQAAPTVSGKRYGLHLLLVGLAATIIAVIVYTFWPTQRNGASSDVTADKESATSEGKSGNNDVHHGRGRRVVFNYPDVPFTFQYPEELDQDKSVQAYPRIEYFLNNEAMGGIGVRQAGMREATIEEIEASLKLEMADPSDTVSHARCGGLDTVFFKKRTMLKDGRAGSSQSYNFARGGHTWQVNFYSDEPPNQTIDAAREDFCVSLFVR